MALFQNSVIQKHLISQDENKLIAAYNKLKVYQARAKGISGYKEEEYQDGFLRDVFVNVLGYTYKYDGYPTFNLLREKKNVNDSKKADGAILKDGEVICVIELKDTTTRDLSKVETQAFGYLTGHSNCKYVIISNFEKLNFYIKNKNDKEEFNLFTCTFEQFQTFYLCLNAENLLSGLPLKVKEKSLAEDEKITKNLYKDYTAFKNETWQNLCINHPNEDKLFLYKKTQKLLDRFLFVFFGEDKGLLPLNSISNIIKKWKDDSDWGDKKPLYDIFKQYFIFINTGRPKSGEREEIYSYNGGLFYTDDYLDKFKIADEILFKHVIKLTNYDFDSEVDINILGHIFEHSLSEIEETEAKLKGEEVDKSKGKRKKDGVFYTPKYITKYIVDNTLGKLCREKKSILELDQDFEIVEYQKSTGGVNKKGEKLFHTLESYKKWLLELKIVDPACGSGAFLNEALSFLIKEHKEVDDLIAELTNTPLRIFDTEKSILENNIYGVDINEESVEIAKLSMWLRTAQKGRKLSNLSNNIKCGNSLIDDPEIAGDKAFNWEQEFPAVFEKGGFDVVIGNPPYVGTKQIDIKDREYFWENYEDLLFSEMDLYEIFLYKSVYELLSEKGYLGFITPNSYYTNISFKYLREYLLLNTSIQAIIDFPYRFYPFDDVNTETSIITLKKEFDSNNTTEFKVVDKATQQSAGGMRAVYKNDIEIPQELISKKYDGLIIIRANSVIDKLIDLNKKFGDYLELHKGWMSVPDKVNINHKIIEQGVFTNQEMRSDSLLASYCNLYLEGRDIHRYYIDKIEKYVYIKDIDKKTKEWHLNPKIILQRIVGQNRNKIFATVDLDNYIIFPNANLVNLKNEKDDVKFYLSILNSSLISYFYNSFFGESNTNLTKLAFETIPIPDILNISQTEFIVKVDLMLLLIEELQDASKKFQRTLQRNLESLEKLSKKLENWHELTFTDFVKELKKKKIVLSFEDEGKWEDYFLPEQQKALEIKAQITKTDKEIDAMVYELYGLTDEEISIVENS